MEAVVPAFMSQAPRPYIFPSISSPPQGSLVQSGAVAHGEDVDVAVQNEMTSRTRSVEGGNKIGELLFRRDGLVFQALRREELSDVGGSLARIAWGNRALDANEASEELDQFLAVVLDRLQQSFFHAHRHFHPAAISSRRHQTE